MAVGANDSKLEISEISAPLLESTEIQGGPFYVCICPFFNGDYEGALGSLSSSISLSCCDLGIIFSYSILFIGGIVCFSLSIILVSLLTNVYILWIS